MTGHVLGMKPTVRITVPCFRSRTRTENWAADSVLHLRDVSEAIIYLVNETSYNGFDKHPVKEGLHISRT